jgi:hypothetical protein
MFLHILAHLLSPASRTKNTVLRRLNPHVTFTKLLLTQRTHSLHNRDLHRCPILVHSRVNARMLPQTSLNQPAPRQTQLPTQNINRTAQLIRQRNRNLTKLRTHNSHPTLTLVTPEPYNTIRTNALKYVTTEKP